MTLSKPTKMGKRDDICSFLGYEKDKPTKDRRNLLKATSTFLDDYEARGSKVYGKKAESIGSRLCAMNFLEEEGRGEKFWPPTTDGSLVYEDACDKEIIIDNVADLFLIHARSNYSKLHARRRSKNSNDTLPPSNVNNEHINHMPPTSIIPEGTYSEDEEPQFTYSSSIMTIEPELCLAPWLAPPKRFDRSVAIPWAESLNPKNFPDPPVRLGKNWLSQENVRWPAAVDKEIQFFMHRWLFYYTMDLENGTDDGIQSLVDLLRNDNGASTELDGSQLREFRKRIVDRVKFFTERFVNHQFVEVQADGVPQMTGRFRNIWTTLKYETPTPRINYRRRSVEDEAPRESPRKRRKLSKKAEDDAVDNNRPKRKPWSEHAWRRKTIPPPADMTFPNLLRRKSSNIDPVTVVESPKSAVDNEEESGGEANEEFEIHRGFDNFMQNSKMAVEIPPFNKPVPSDSDVIIKMEEESTIEVSQLDTSAIEFSDDEPPSETIKVVPLTHERPTETSSPIQEDIPTLEKIPPCLQDKTKASQAQLPLLHQSNDTSKNNGLSKQPQLLDSHIIPSQLLEIVAAGPQVNKLVDAGAEVIGSAQLSVKADNQNPLPQTGDTNSSFAINETSQIIVERNNQPMVPDENRQPPRPKLVESPSPTQIADHSDEPPKQSTSSHGAAVKNDSHNASDFIVPSGNSSCENPKKYGPFHDLACLNKLFSSSGSRPVEALRSRNISPKSVTNTHTRELDTTIGSANVTQKSASPRTASSIELHSKCDLLKGTPSQGEAPKSSQSIGERPKTSECSLDATQPQSSNYGHISSLDALEKEQKPFEKSILSFTRTPLPSVPVPLVPLHPKDDRKSTNPSPAIRSSPTTMGESQKQPYESPQPPLQKAIQNSQADSSEPLIATFQPINRPMNGVNSSPSNDPSSSVKEPPQPSPAPMTHNAATNTHKPRIKSHETRNQRELQDLYLGLKYNENVPAQNSACQSTIGGTPPNFSWTKDPQLNLHPINTQNGVYPMAFIKKPMAAKNGVWTQGICQKRPLEGTSTKPRKTKSRKKSGLPENSCTESATVQYQPALSSQACQNMTASAMQMQSSLQPFHDQEQSPKPPHPELIKHLRIMDENMGVNSGASFQSVCKMTNPPPTSNQQPTNHTENADQNMNYQARKEQNLLNFAALQETLHSIRDLSSQEWGNIKNSVDVHRATSVAVASSSQLQRTSSTPQVRPSLPKNLQTARSEHGTVKHGTRQEQDKRPKIEEQSRIDPQNSIQQSQGLPNVSEQTRNNPQVGKPQGQAASNANICKSNMENRNQSRNRANIGYNEGARPLETEMRHGSSMDNGKGPTVQKSASVTSPNTPQNSRGPQVSQKHDYNHVRPSSTPTQTNQHLNQESQPLNHHKSSQNYPYSPESYQSQDPWWNSLAANYNIKKLSQPPSRFVSRSDTDINTQHKRLMSNESPISAAQTAPPIQARNQEHLPRMRQVAPQVSESSHPKGSRAYNPNIYRQTPESQHNDHRPESSTTQGQLTRSHSNHRYLIHLSPIQMSNSLSQGAPPSSGVRTSTPQNHSSNQTLSQASNGTVPSPKTQFYQPPSQSSNVLDTSKGQYVDDTSIQSPDTQSVNPEHQFYSQPAIQPNSIKSSAPQNQSANRATQFSPIEPSSPQNQYAGPAPIQQSSSVQIIYSPEYNELQNQTASQYQYPKRPLQPAEAQNSTMQTQQKIYSGKQPLDWTQYQLHGPSSKNSMSSANSSPRQPPTTTNQAAKTSLSQPPPTQIPMTQSSPASNMSTLLNHSLPPTPPTPATFPTLKLDTITQFPSGTHPLAGSTTRQQISTIVTTPKLDIVSQYPPITRPLAVNSARQQTPAAINHTPKLDSIPLYSPITHPLATPQQTPTTPQAVGPKLDFYLQRSNSTIDTTSSFSYHYMEALSLSSLFFFFSQRSGVPMERLDELTFRCMFGEYQQFVVGKYMGDGEWKRARKRIWRNWDREVRAAKQNGNDDDEEFWEVNILIGKCV